MNKKWSLPKSTYILGRETDVVEICLRGQDVHDRG